MGRRTPECEHARLRVRVRVRVRVRLWAGAPPSVSIPLQVAGRGLQHGSAASGSRVYDGGVLGDTEAFGRRVASCAVVAERHARSRRARTISKGAARRRDHIETVAEQPACNSLVIHSQPDRADCA